MSSALDQSLDQLAASRGRSGRRGRRGTPRTVDGAAPAANGGAAPKATAARARYSAGAVPAANGNRVVPTAPAAPAQADATKILVSNLPTDVNEPQVKELFASTVGPTREVTLTYDAKGHSKGIASVTFSRRGDANKAFSQYNGRLVDGKRPMKIEIIVDPARPATLSQRVAPAPAPAAPAGQAAAGNGAPRARGQGGPKRGASGRARGGGKKNAERPSKTAADLDAEMEDYSKTSTPAVAV